MSQAFARPGGNATGLTMLLTSPGRNSRFWMPGGSARSSRPPRHRRPLPSVPLKQGALRPSWPAVGPGSPTVLWSSALGPPCRCL